MSETLLQVRDLKVYYPVKTQSIIPRKVYVKAVDGISFDVRRKEAFGIVGESGCGKSTTGHAIVGLLKPTSGQILFEGQSIVGGAAISKERTPTPPWIPALPWAAASASRWRYTALAPPRSGWSGWRS